MDIISRFEDCLDEAHGEELSSQIRAKEISSLYNQQMVDLIDERIGSIITKFGFQPTFIPANEEIAIRLPVQILGK